MVRIHTYAVVYVANARANGLLGVVTAPNCRRPTRPAC
jgi:hypothetical protein